jgi:hypothetical protein
MGRFSIMNLDQHRLVVLCAGLSTAAGIIHLIVTSSHFEEWLGYGVFFLVAAIAQIGYAVVLMINSPNPTMLWAGICGNGAIILLWLTTRTVGIPFFGPNAWEIEPVGLLDSISKIIEIFLVIGLVVLWRSLLYINHQKPSS